MKIITNKVPRHLIYGHELTPSERRKFEARYDRLYVRYHGWVYDVGEFMPSSDSGALKGWDGYIGDSYYSGVLIRYVDEDQVIMGRYYS